MGFTLTDVLLFGKAQSDDADNATLVIYRRNILRWGAIATAVDVVVRGVPPIVLPQAVANGIHYINAYGGTKLSYDIQVEYTQVEYVQNAANTLVKTGVVPGPLSSMKMEILVTASVPSGSTGGTFYIFQAREAGGSIFGIAGTQAAKSISGNALFENESGISSSITRVNGKQYNVVYTAASGTQTLEVENVTDSTSDTKTASYTTIVSTTAELCLFGNTSADSNRIYQNNKVHYAKFWRDGVLVLDLIPVKRKSDNVVGFYNRVDGRFLTATEGSLRAGNEVVPTPSDPLDIYCNNGKISVLDHTNWNVITNPNSETGKGMFINTDGKLTKVSDRGAGVFIPVTVGKKYTVLINRKTVALGEIIRYGQSNNGSVPNSAEQLLDWYRGSISDGMMISFTAKRPYFVMQLAASLVEAGGIDEAIEVIEAQGDNETLKLTPSNDTAGVANLLKIASDADTQEILTGAINHKIGIRVLDGTEDWSAQTGGGATWYEASLLDTNMFSHLVCTHFVNAPVALNNDAVYKSAGSAVLQIRYDTASDLTAFKSWLASQYSAGTPVIVVYGLETAQDEVAPIPQTMQTVAGDNTLDIVQAGMSGLEVEVKYTTGVAVSITEVENAQLDDNITVTIE